VNGPDRLHQVIIREIKRKGGHQEDRDREGFLDLLGGLLLSCAFLGKKLGSGLLALIK
jgi:hypothetical protein